jgi:hypothetical protein
MQNVVAGGKMNDPASSIGGGINHLLQDGGRIHQTSN